MVISVLSGGLGNQLFQYAFGLRLAAQLQTELRLERHLLESKALARLRQYTPRTYELDTFTVQAPAASLADTVGCLSRVALTGKNALLLREPTLTPKAIDELDSRIQDVVCLGYWQSEDYFKPATAQLRKQLIFRKDPAQSRSVAATILSYPNAAFVHIRRGDYVTNSHANQHHGLCDVSYYRRSCDYVKERVPDVQFFVFSDDPDWAKRELGNDLQPALFIDHNRGADSWQDMYLMSLCRHAIVANSSFSWWGAWLNPVADRLVVAPCQWFANQPVLSQQIIPRHWLCL